MISLVLGILAAAAGLISATLWWHAATIIIPKGDPRSKGSHFIDDIDTISTAHEQGKWNRWAAAATGMAALLSGLAAFAGAMKW